MLQGVYNGAASACGAVKRTVWASETVEENARNSSTVSCFFHIYEGFQGEERASSFRLIPCHSDLSAL